MTSNNNTPANPISLRKPDVRELSLLSNLCMRSKAHWGYDDDFMTACIDELSVTKHDLETGLIMLATIGADISGVAQISIQHETAELERMFIDPNHMGRSVGRVLFEWASSEAQKLGAKSLTIVSDPFAAPFYERMGCKPDGTTPSGSIPGRHLPRFKLDLTA